MTKIVLFLIVLFPFAQALQAGAPDTLKIVDMPQVEVVSKKTTLLNRLPGAASRITARELQVVAPLNGKEVLRRMTGLHVVDEEGAGLRLNLSIRGLDPDRSRNVLLLEDGLPVSLNPYGESEYYYTPVMDRMSGVEVLKGSGQLLFGPQTIGGVVNFVTKDPPAQREGRVKLNAGQGGFGSVLASYGNTVGNAGYQVNYLHKRADRIAYAGFALHDLSAKVRIVLSPKSSIGIKLGYYQEWTDATYIGLTQTMYDRGGQDFVQMAPHDQLVVKRISGSVTHRTQLRGNLSLQTAVFAYTTERNWQRQEFSSSPTASMQTGVIWGDTSVVGGALYMRDLNAHRNRRFEVLGAESRLFWQHRLFGKKGEMQAGVRAIAEKANEKRFNGRFAADRTGDLVEDEIRPGHAFSAFVQEQWQLSKALTVHAGLRSEFYRFERNTLRNTFMLNGTAQVRDTNLVTTNQVDILLPGVGANLNLNASHTLFAGLHRGFAPPRVKDALTAQGVVYNLEAERSWNSELGGRGHFGRAFAYEVTLYRMDFSNQVIPVSESSGGAGAGLVNGGRTLHQGIELGWQLDAAPMLGLKKWSLEWKSAVTLQQSVFAENRFQQRGSEWVNVKGNFIPYSPQRLLNTMLHVSSPLGLGGQFTVQSVGQQYADVLNTVAPRSDGRIGLLPGYTILDANLYYRIPGTGIECNVAVKNLSNERYIATRRPQGIRLGTPRFLMAGIDIRF